MMLGAREILVVTAAVTVVTFGLTATKAADLADDCCADLEERVAELEATTTRKGNRNVSLTVSATISHAVLYWDDGEDSDAYVVGNDNDGTSFEFKGRAEKIGGSDWSLGFVMEIGILSAQSSEVSQIDPVGPQALERDEEHVWIRHEHLGQLSWGLIGGTSKVDDATEMDLSEARAAGFSGVDDIGGSFFLRREPFGGSGGLTSVTWGDLIDHLPGIDGQLVRYDTPTKNGLAGWAEWGDDDIWEVTLTYGDPATLEDLEDGANEMQAPQPTLFKNFQLAAAISYFGATGNVDLPDHRGVSGSVSVLHQPSGLNLSVAAGRRLFAQSVALNNGTAGKPQDPFFYYVKPGLLLEISEAGKTAFYAEYGKFRDFLGRDADEDAVAGLAGINADNVCELAEACLVSESEATIWGFGIVQHLDNANVQIYVGARHYEANIELVDRQGIRVTSRALDDFFSIISGMTIEF